MSDPVPVRVVESHPAAEGIHRLVLDDAPFAAQHERPGQYAVLQLPDGRKSYFARLSAPGDANAEYLLGRGAVAEELARLREGQLVTSSAPQGKGFDLESVRGLDLLLIGTGTGLGPLRSTLRWLASRRGDFGRVTLVYGARTPPHVPLRGELDRLAREDVELDIVYSQHGDEPGYVQDRVVRRGGDLSRTAVVAVGQKEMIQMLRERLPGLRFDLSRLLLNF